MKTVFKNEMLDLYPPGSGIRLIRDTHEKSRAWSRKYIYGIKRIPITNHDILQEYNEFEEKIRSTIPLII